MDMIFLPDFMHSTTFLQYLRRFSAWWVAMVWLICLGATPAVAIDAQAPTPPPAATTATKVPTPPPAVAPVPQTPTPLKDAVLLLNANSANDALSMPMQPGTHDLDLYLQVTKLKQPQQGKLIITKFRAQAPPGDVVAPTMHLGGGSGTAGDDAPLDVSLAPAEVLHVKLTGGVFRPGSTYKGSLFLTSGGQTHHWDITLNTPGRGILAVGPVGMLKFSRFFGGITGSFPFTLYDKSELGPYHHVRVRFEPGGTPAAKAITSNFNLASFSFLETTKGQSDPIDLAQRGQKLPGMNLDYRGQRTFTALIKPLSPGEYTGTLRFVADEASDDAAEAKLPLTIQVRDHWLWPVIIIFFGSLLGWYCSKYVISVRKGNELKRQVTTLRARADDLARPDPPREGWEFHGEATSYGLALVRVQLSELALLASGLAFLFREEEIQKKRSEAELRVTALEALQETRLQVQKVAVNRPTAQWALGGLLLKASDLIERPTFDQTQMTALTDLLKSAKAWIPDDTFDTNYREALAKRLTSQEIPSLNTVQALPKNEVQQQLEVLLRDFWPTKDKIKDQDLTALQEYDQTIAKVALLWREMSFPWATDLASACERNEPIKEIFRIVDSAVWAELKTASETDDQLRIESESVDQGPLKTYDLLIVRLRSYYTGLDDWRLLRHPLRVKWRIDPPDHEIRCMTNHDLAMAQYFPAAGEAKIEAALQWQGEPIPIKNALPLTVVRNREFGNFPLLSGWFTESLVILVAAGFAVATAMATMYDSTFGSFSQYLALFLWSAGVGTGGNIFQQLGTTSTLGGQANVSLPRGSAPAAAPATR